MGCICVISTTPFLSKILPSMFLNFLYVPLPDLVRLFGQILDRGDKIELLVGKTETLQSQVCMALDVFGSLCEKWVVFV
jgi:hypothetical protein